MHGRRVLLHRLERLETLDAFSLWLTTHHDWVGGFDMPFGLPRELIEHLGWPFQWIDCMRHYATLTREQIRQTFSSFCQARPVGRKFAHRATDKPAGSSPSMKWVNPPVAYMLHAGIPRLIDAGCHIPALHSGDICRVALEAYPALLAREAIANRSYKSDDRAKQTPERLIARKDILTTLENGHTQLELSLKLPNAQRDALIHDASGDSLDATLCMLQAAWALTRHEAGDQNFGLPETTDPLEGWIVTAEAGCFSL